MPDADDPAKRLGVRPAPSRPAFRCEELTLMPRPHEQRPSKLRNAASRPDDDADAYSGGWSRERLIAMDARYCELMRAALIKDKKPPTIWSPGIRSRRRHRQQAARSPLVRFTGLRVTQP